MNATSLKPRSHDSRQAPRTRTGSPRKSRSFRPTSEGLEQRLQLSAQTLGALSGSSLVGHVGPITLPPPTPLADLGVVSVNVQGLGNNQFKVTATLENVPPTPVAKANFVGVGGGGPVVTPGVTYPGGGVFTITRTDGGTSISMLPNGTVLDTPDPVQTIASMPIPALAPGQTVQLSTVTTGRAIFTATAGPAFVLGHPVARLAHPVSFPEANPLNDSKTVDALISHTLPVNTSTLALVPALQNAVQNAQFRLDANDSFVSIPGIVNEHFQIPGKTVSIGIGPISFSATYTVNNLVSTGTTLTYEQGGLAVTVKFADNQHALHTTSSIAPDIGVTNLQVKVLLPLSYDANGQYLNITNPKVTVTGNWSADGLLGPVFNLLLPDINSKIASGLTVAIAPKLGLLSFQLNTPLHDLTAGGRIVSADIQQDQMILTVETPQ